MSLDITKKEGERETGVDVGGNRKVDRVARQGEERGTEGSELKVTEKTEEEGRGERKRRGGETKKRNRQ